MVYSLHAEQRSLVSGTVSYTHLDVYKRQLYKRYESGASLRNLEDWLEANQIKTVLGESKWTTTSIKSILTNEKYCGDVLLQKTFRTDVISKKAVSYTHLFILKILR